MKLTTLNNSEIVIQGKEGEFQLVKKVAEKIIELSQGQVVYCSDQENEDWIHLTACWDFYQASEFKYFYKEAKKAA